MSPETMLQTGILIALLATSAFCSASEAVFFSLNPLDVRRIGQQNAALGCRLHDLLARPTRLLSTILILNTLANSMATSVSFLVTESLWPAHARQIAIPAMTLLLLFFGEYGPKRFGLLFPETLARLFSGPIGLAIRVLTPPRLVLEAITDASGRLFRPAKAAMSSEEFSTIVDISRDEGIINAEELAMVQAIIHLDDRKASDIMTPRVDLKGIDLNADPSTFVSTARAARVKHLLLYRDQPDNVEGLLDVRRYLLDPAHRIPDSTIPTLFTPATCVLSRLLQQMQKTSRRAAVVVDEYGGVSGIVTRGDILEEISGDIYHELAKPRPIFQEAGPHRWLVDANFSLEDLNEKLLLDLSAEGADRLAGWIASHSGHLPAPGDIVEAQGVRATVMKTDRRRVTLAQIEKLEPKRPVETP